jgi:hypothetical protein
MPFLCAQVLGRRRADGSSLIRCSELLDGAVAFEDEADAERYGQLLEAEGAFAEASAVEGGEGGLVCPNASVAVFDRGVCGGGGARHRWSRQVGPTFA